MRLRCHLFGCEVDHFAPFCRCCQADVYEPDYLTAGRLDPVRWSLVRLRRRIGRLFRVVRCEVCRRRLWPWSRRFSDECCSEKCWENAIPF